MTVIADIIDVIKTRIESVVVGDDFDVAVNRVVLPTQYDISSLEHADVVVASQDPKRNAELSCPGNPAAIAYDLSVMVAIVIAPSTGDERSFDEIATALGTACQKAVATQDSWHEFDGNAINATIGPLISVKPGAEQQHGIGFELVVTYRVSENNQNELR